MSDPQQMCDDAEMPNLCEMCIQEIQEGFVHMLNVSWKHWMMNRIFVTNVGVDPSITIHDVVKSLLIVLIVFPFHREK